VVKKFDVTLQWNTSSNEVALLFSSLDLKIQEHTFCFGGTRAP